MLRRAREALPGKRCVCDGGVVPERVLLAPEGERLRGVGGNSHADRSTDSPLAFSHRARRHFQDMAIRSRSEIPIALDSLDTRGNLRATGGSREACEHLPLLVRTINGTWEELHDTIECSTHYNAEGFRLGMAFCTGEY